MQRALRRILQTTALLKPTPNTQLPRSIFTQHLQIATMHEQAMDQATLKQYLADDPPTIVPLSIKPHFEALNEREQKYAHFISRASHAGTRINLRQVSPESEGIFDFILALHRSVEGMSSFVFLFGFFLGDRLTGNGESKRAFLIPCMV